MKAVKIIFFLALFHLMCGLSCKKPDPQPQPTPATPVFTLTATVDEAPVSIQAGVNDYFMFTSYALDANGLYDFTGELRDKSCTSNCPTSLKISIKDYRAYSPDPTNIDSSLVPGYYSIATPTGTPTKFYVLFWDTLVNGTPQTFSWDFGDGNTLIYDKPAHIYYHPGVYPVKLTTQSAGACSSSLSNDVILGQAGNAFVPVFKEILTNGDTVHFGGNPGGVAPDTWVVDFGDGNSVANNTHWVNIYAAPGIYKASLTATDSTGYTGVERLNAATKNATSCYTDFNVVNTIAVANPTNRSGVIIEWRDATGNLYTSSNDNQPGNSMFKIISVDNYDNNTSGQTTKKIHAKITCRLYNGANSIVFNGDIVFSVAHP